MTEFKTSRTPLFPSIPNEKEHTQFVRLEKWRRDILRLIQDMHTTVRDDIAIVANQCGVVTIFEHQITSTNGTWGVDIDANQMFNHVFRN